MAFIVGLVGLPIVAVLVVAIVLLAVIMWISGSKSARAIEWPAARRLIIPDRLEIGVAVDLV